MDNALAHIMATLKAALQKHERVLKVTSDTEDKYEVHGTIPAQQGKQKVDGIYFASVLMKPKDVRFYFFPIYTHKRAIEPHLHDDARKFLKGKSCFHVKRMDDTIAASIQSMIDEGIRQYQADGLLAS